MIRIKRQPLAIKVAEELKQEIANRSWTDILPSEHKLSADIGVSRTTLRRALSLLAQQGWVSIRQGSPTRILKTMPEAQRPKTRKATRTIGVLTPVPLSELKPYALFWIDELRSLLHALDYGLHLHHGKVYYREHTGRALSDLVKSQPADCWILSFTSPHIQHWFQNHGLPTIVQGYPAPGIELPFVSYDCKAIMFHALGRLTAKGHRNIAMLSDNTESAGRIAFENCFTETCSRQSKQKVKGRIIKPRDGEANTVKNAIRMALKSESPPTAFVAINPLHCLTAVTSLPRWGYRIPDDVSVITTFGDPSLEFLNPVPAHYSAPYKLMAKKTSDLAMKLISGIPLSSSDNYMMPDPVPGQSIAPPKTKSYQNGERSPVRLYTENRHNL